MLVSPPQHPLTSSPHRPGSQECFPSCAEGKLTSRSSTSALRLAPRSPASARSSGLKSSRKRRRRQGGGERPMYEGAQLTLLFPHALVLWHASAQERSRGVHGCHNALVGCSPLELVAGRACPVCSVSQETVRNPIYPCMPVREGLGGSNDPPSVGRRLPSTDVASCRPPCGPAELVTSRAQRVQRCRYERRSTCKAWMYGPGQFIRLFRSRGEQPFVARRAEVILVCARLCAAADAPRRVPAVGVVAAERAGGRVSGGRSHGPCSPVAWRSLQVTVMSCQEARHFKRQVHGGWRSEA